MKRFALLCMIVAGFAILAFAATNTEKTIPLKLNANSQQSIARQLQGLQLQKAGNAPTPINLGLNSKNVSALPPTIKPLAVGTSNGIAPDKRSLFVPAPAVQNTAIEIGSSIGNLTTSASSLQARIDALEGQIDQVLAAHGDAGYLFQQVDALYAMRPPQSDLPLNSHNDIGSKGGNDISVVPVTPCGDSCANATNIPSLPYCTTCNTRGMIDNYTPFCLAGALSGPDAVYKYTPATDQIISVSLCGSSFHTVLSIFDNCPDPNNPPICCSDHGCGPNNLQSCCSGVQLTAGHTYYFVVDGATPADFGMFLLHVDFGYACPSAPCFPTDQCRYPSHDLEPLNNVCGSTDLPALACDTLCGQITSREDRDWYRFVVPENTCLTLKIDVYGNDTPGFYPYGKGLDPYVAVYGANCSTLLFSDDTSGVGNDARLITDCLPTGVYYVRVTGAFGSHGPYVIATTCTPCDCHPQSCIECPTNAILEREGCSPNAVTINGGCNDFTDFGITPQYGQIQCGDVLCGTFWEARDGYYRDTDWYRFTLTERDSVRFTGRATKGYVMLIMQLTGAVQPCDAINYLAYALGDSCATTTVAACLPAGDYIFFMAPQFYLGNFNCARYAARMECLPCSPRLLPCVLCPTDAAQEDEACSPTAPQINGGCDGPAGVPFLFSSINCGQTYCGTSWELAGPNGNYLRDTDWYQFTVTPERDSVAFLFKAGFNAVASIVRLANAAPCPGTAVLNATADSCQEIVFATCLQPGSYAVVIAPAFGQVFECRPYVLGMQCLSCGPRPPCVICPENARHEDEACVNIPDNYNGGCRPNSVPPLEPSFAPISCNDLICGRTSITQTATGALYADEDWYRLVLNEGESLNVCIRADYPVRIAVFAVNAIESCTLMSTVLFEDSPACSTACFGRCLPAGIYYIATVPVQNSPLECGHYVLSTQCQPCGVPPCIVCPTDAVHENEPCPNYPDNFNGGCNVANSDNPPQFSDLLCNTPVCGTSWLSHNAAGGVVYDTDWYMLNLTQPDSVTFVFRSQFPALVAIAQVTGDPICNNLNPLTGETLVPILPCYTYGGAICLPAGRYVVILLPNYNVIQGELFCGQYMVAAICQPCAPRECVQCPENSLIEDEACGPNANPINNGCDTPPVIAPLYGHINCGQTICATSWQLTTDAGNVLSDKDWFQFTVGDNIARDSIVFTYNGGFSALATIISQPAAAPCPGEVVFSTLTDSCHAFRFGKCLTPGTYSIVITPAPGEFFDCRHYWLDMECLPCNPCPTEWAVDGYDIGNLPVCYPTLPMNPAHGLSGIAWLGQNPTVNDGVNYLNLPWTPCAMETVVVAVTGGPNYPRYARCGGQLFLNGWKDGNHNGNFCDTREGDCGADEWIVQDSLVQPGVYVLPLRDPGITTIGHYDGVFRWRLTSQRIGRFGFGQATTQCNNVQCGNFAVDFLGEVEDSVIHDAQLAVTLQAFDAMPGDGQVALRWTTASETNNDHFDIFRDGRKIATIATQGNEATAHHYSYTDASVNNGTTYSYSLVAVNTIGESQTLSTTSSSPSMSAATITEYALQQNYPNPFNPTTNIMFDLVDAGNVKLQVYNLVGQVVATLVNSSMPKGRHTVSFDAGNLPTGIYVYRLEVNGFTAARKMLLTK